MIFICKKCQSLFSGKIRQMLEDIVYSNVYPSMVSVKRRWLTFSWKCLLRRQFAWNDNAYVLGNKTNSFWNGHLLKCLPSMLSVKVLLTFKVCRLKRTLHSILRQEYFMYSYRTYLFTNLQLTVNDSNIDGLFTVANSISFLNLQEILPKAQENKYLGKLTYFIMKCMLCVLITITIIS